MDERAKRISKAIEKCGYSYPELSKITGISKSSLQRYATGETKKIPIDCIEKIANATGTSAKYLMGWEENNTANECKTDKINEANLSETLDSKKIRLIPVFESVSAGFGARADERIVDYLPLFIEHDYDAENTLAIKVKGDSMYPKIEDGDIVAVRKQSDFENGNIVVILVDNDEGLVKKIYQDSDKVRLVSINPEYPDKIFKGEEICRLRVVGVVKQIIKNV